MVHLGAEKGEIVKSYEYDAFGNELNPDENDANPFRYSGEYYDQETGTIYLRARYYNPVIGSFITEDTYLGEINDPLSLNLYTYCTNNPVMFVDPSGHTGIAILNLLDWFGEEEIIDICKEIEVATDLYKKGRKIHKYIDSEGDFIFDETIAGTNNTLSNEIGILNFGQLEGGIYDYGFAGGEIHWTTTEVGLTTADFWEHASIAGTIEAFKVGVGRMKDIQQNSDKWYDVGFKTAAGAYATALSEKGMIKANAFDFYLDLSIEQTVGYGAYADAAINYKSKDKVRHIIMLNGLIEFKGGYELNFDIYHKD